MDAAAHSEFGVLLWSDIGVNLSNASNLNVYGGELQLERTHLLIEHNI
jgi:hypothetical protein